MHLLLETSESWKRKKARDKLSVAANTCTAAKTEALIQQRFRMELIGLAERRAEELGCGLRWGSGTYASRVQQVSPSTSPPGALSVLTDSFSLAGMLTGRGTGADGGREGGSWKRKRWMS